MNVMSKDKSIVFNSIPANFKRHERVYVIQYEFSGIQSFIFGDVTLSSTREEIASRSEFVQMATEQMERWLSSRFTGWAKFRVLSRSSGKLICAVSHWTKEKKIISLSEEIQRILYASTDGRLEMFYAYCEAKVVGSDEHEKYENAMSILAVGVNKNKFHCINTLGVNIDCDKKEEFTPGLSGSKGGSIKTTNDIMVAIKFDLDNLGSFFQKIFAFDERKAASECLADVLNGAFVGIPDVSPLFIGGDDIFAIAKLDTYFMSVTQMYKNIVKGIMSYKELQEYQECFGISGGISFIRNDLGSIPLVYYFEQSEDKLIKAKSVFGKNVVSVSNCIITWEQLEMLSSILARKHAAVFGGLSDQQTMNMYFNVLELKSRLLRVHKNTGRKLLTKEEEKSVYSIN